MHAIPRPHPTVLLLTAMVLGIVVDDVWKLSFFVWLTTTGVCFLLWLNLRSRFLGSSFLTLIAITSVSGLSSHTQREMAASNDIRCWVHQDRSIVVLTGHVISVPATRTRPTLMAGPTSTPEIYTRLEFDCQSLIEPERETPISGRLVVSIDGERLDLTPGSRLKLYGQLRASSPPLNPTDFDYGRYLKDHCLAATLRVDHPESIEVLPPSGWTPLNDLLNARQQAREYLQNRLRAVMPAETYPLAAALLLGTRDDLSDEVSTAFQNTGLMHLISISGLHLTLIVAMFVVVIKMLPISPMQRQWLLLFILVTYLFFVDLRPPVLRAGMLVALWMSATLLMRDPPLDHLLVLSTIVLLAIDPSSLFDMGAQLSFLCLYAISQANRWYQAWETFRRPVDPPDEPEKLSWWRRWWKAVEFGFLWIPLGIVFITGPFLLQQFGQFSAVSLLLSVPLSWFLGFVLGIGVAMLPLLVLPTALVSPLAFILHWSLVMLQEAVIWSEQIPFMLVHSSGLGTWWLAVYFALWSIPLFFLSTTRGLTSWHRHTLTLAVGWAVIGLGITQASNWMRPRQIELTFHAVGHGNATIMKLPNGRTMLVDAGSFYGTPYTVTSLRRTLTTLGISQLDLVVISHTDADHYNLLPYLADTIPIRQLLISHASLREQSPSYLALCDQLARNGCQIHFVHAGDQIPIDPDVTLNVLHPSPREADWGDSDNENSIVLDCQYGGRRMLLTGDIESDGLKSLMETTQPKSVDLLIVPHHGAKGSNPIVLGAWAQPSFAIASTNKSLAQLPHLSATYPTARHLLSTGQGAIRVFWTAQSMTIEQYQAGRWTLISE
ncbi:ComEC/Rec2 family competence protein [Lacunimicrobium album]